MSGTGRRRQFLIANCARTVIESLCRRFKHSSTWFSAHLVCLFCPLVAACGSMAAAANERTALATVAERSNYRATATHAEVITLCRELAAASPSVHLTSMGKTFEGRDQPLLVISRDGIDAPGGIERDKHACLFAMGNIHAGEVCGKEALLALAREFAQGAHHEVLDQLVILFAPIYNADGNERFSKTNRPGQLGPADGMGQRPNAQGLDLNRDHMKLESPEARNLARLATTWDPLVLIDTHTTNGSIHEYTVTYDGPRNPATPDSLIQFVREDFLPTVGRRMETGTGYKSFYYGNFSRDASRWETYPDLPRFSTHYFGLRGRLGILSEAYSYASYKDRVLATKAFVKECIYFTHEHAEKIHALTCEACERLAEDADPPGDVAIRSWLAPLPGKFEVLGNAEINPYDSDSSLSDTPSKTYSLVYMGKSKSTESIESPFAYLIPPTLAKVAANLTAHGVELHELIEATSLDVEVYSLDSIERDERPFQGHRRITLEVSRREESRQVPAGWLVAKTAQPLGVLLISLVEPRASDGLASWNFVDEQLEIGREYPILRVAEAPVWRLSPSPSRERISVRFDRQDSGVTASLRGLSIPDSEIAWASGSEGTVIRTKDGGETWENVSISDAQACDFRDIEAFDEREAIVISAGSPARIYSTDDGGETWRLRYENDDASIFFDAFGFWSRTHGIAFSDPIGGKIFLIGTDDGGETWHELPMATRPAATDGEAGFAASGTCLALSGKTGVQIGLGGATKAGRARVLRSTDHGATWNSVSTPIICNESSGIFSLAFCDLRNGVAVGGNYKSPEDQSSNAAVTRDGGLTWNKPAAQSPQGYRSCVTVGRVGDQTLLLAVGTSGCDLSLDLGDS